MKVNQFRLLTKAIVNNCLIILNRKRVEYTVENSDVFYNFCRVSQADSITKEQALWGMYLKHWASVRDIVKDTERLTNEHFSLKWKEKIEEKIIDSINYHLILYGLLKERINCD